MPSMEKDERDKEINAGTQVLSVGIVLRTTIADWREIDGFLKTRSSTKVVHVRRSEGALWIVPV